MIMAHVPGHEPLRREFGDLLRAAAMWMDHVLSKAQLQADARQSLLVVLNAQVLLKFKRGRHGGRRAGDADINQIRH